MKSGTQIVIYGSYGYTGKLIVQECIKQQFEVVLAGRNEQALKEQSENTGYPYQVVEIKEEEKLRKLLTPATLVIHCGGPFLFTAEYMLKACLETGTHYTDITGEIGILELLAKYDKQAEELGVMILPGIGFDVVPSDCLAMHLKNRLPSATHLELAFAMSDGGISRGTAKTTVVGLGEGSLIRKEGQVVKVPLHEGLKEIDFGKLKTISARIPWGDVSTAYHSTGIPNIAVYMAISKKIAFLIRFTRFFNWLMKKQWARGFLLRIMDRIEGPSESSRENSKCYLTGKAWNDKQFVESRMETPNGYSLTVLSCVLIANKILKEEFKTGFQTASSTYGADLILECEGVNRTDL